MESTSSALRTAVSGLLLMGMVFAWSCSGDKPAYYYPLPTPPIPEDESIGPLPAVPEDALDLVVSGDARAAAETLLALTLDERSALACVLLLMPRLDDSSSSLDKTILYGESGQPVWWRMYHREYHSPPIDRRSQVFERLADCIREATPSQERAAARRQFFSYLKTGFLEVTAANVELAARAVRSPRQDWLIATLEDQINQGIQGDWQIHSEPVALLSHLVLPTNSSYDVQKSITIRNPYRKLDIVNFLLERSASRGTGSEDLVQRALDVLEQFDGETADIIRSRTSPGEDLR